MTLPKGVLALSIVAFLLSGPVVRAQVESRPNLTAEAVLNRATFEATARALTVYDRRGGLVKTLRERGSYQWVAMSPDGRSVAVVRQETGSRNSHIWVVNLSTERSTRVTAASSRYDCPVWSPDGLSIAYVAVSAGWTNVYRRAADGTGDEELLYERRDRLILTDWSSDGRFLSFSSIEVDPLDPAGLNSGSGLYVLPINENAAAKGRMPIEVFHSDTARAHGARFSPDGRFVAYRSNESGVKQIWVRPVAPGGVATQISVQGALGMAAWRRDGRELYYLGTDRAVMAVEIDTGARVVVGRPRHLFDAPETIPLVADYPFLGAPDGLATISRDGEHVVFAALPKAKGAAFLQQLMVFDREGKVVRRLGKPGEYTQPQLSPDATRLAAYRGRALWIFDLSNDRSVQITPGGSSYSVAWSPTGRDVAYAAYRNEHSVVYRKSADGVGNEESLYQHNEPGAFIPLTEWSPDGQFVSFNGGNVLGTASIAGQRKLVELPPTDFNVFSARLSPDSRFVAYVSDESGRHEVYVRQFDVSSGYVAGQIWQVSNDGGLGLVQWRGDGRELYYLARDGRIMAIDVTTVPTFRAGPAKVLFRVPEMFPADRTNYPDCSCATAGGCEQGHISRDGERFVFAVPVPPERKKISIGRGALARYAGTYILDGKDLVLSVEGDRLMFDAGQGKVPLSAESRTTFYLTTTNGDLEFIATNGGEVSHFLMYTGGTPRLATRRTPGLNDGNSR
jgi:Tol biopolymer transport system component